MSQPGYIYIIQSGEYFKIGFSIKPAQRVKEVRYFRRPKLVNEPTVLHTIAVEDMRESETVLHALLHAARVEGEWFVLSDKEIEWLLSLTPESLNDLVERFKRTMLKPIQQSPVRLRVREASEARGLSLTYLHAAVNRLRQDEVPVAMNTLRRYWYSTRDGKEKGPPFELVDIVLLGIISQVLKVPLSELIEVSA